jgi:two-component system chemotaxis sensor kinase CheA
MGIKVRNSQAVQLAGDCIVSTVNSHHQELVEALRNAKAITVDLSQIGNIDISFIQLMVSASRTAARQSKSLNLLGAAGPIEAAFRGAGIDIDPISGQLSF